VPASKCPNCESKADVRLLESPSALSEARTVNYYRCGDCGHVWTVNVEENKIIQDVTPKKPKSSS
jgi:uncharacterized Zn finger protein